MNVLILLTISFILLNVFLISTMALTMYNLILFNVVFLGMFILYLVRVFSNLTNYVFITLLVGGIISYVVYTNKTLQQYSKLFRGGNFLVGFLLVLSVITVFGLIKWFHYYTKIINMDPPMGDKGPQGKIGNTGKTLDNNMNMCYNQAVEKVEQLMRKYKGTGNYDPKILLFNNLYMKRQLKRICESNKYSAEKMKYGSHYTPVQIVNNDIEKAIVHLLKYENGMRFLEDHFFTKYHWNTDLLSKNPSLVENINPFNYIETLDVWGWE